MKYEYSNEILKVLEKAEKANEKSLETFIEKLVENIENDHIIHTFGTGHSHMVGIELFVRAGGLGNVNAILDPNCLTNFGAQRSGALEKVSGISDVLFDSYKINKGDMMIITSNSGRNAMPIEMAMRCKKEGIYTVALTNLEQSKKTTSRHSSGKKLYEIADLVIDNACPDGDAMMQESGLKFGPASSIVTFFLVNIATSEAIKRVIKNGKKPMIFQSQNVDGFSNDDIYNKYDGIIKHI